MPCPAETEPSTTTHHDTLSGSIPPELGSLHNLSHIVLEANSLTGQIPPELGNLRVIERLNLADRCEW